MVIVGPGIIRRGVSPETALIGSGDMAYLGPALGEGTLDPIHRIFLLVGKIMSIRRVVKHESETQGPDLIAQYKQAQVALIDQVTSAHDSQEASEFEVIWEDTGYNVRDLTIEMERMASATDEHVRSIFDKESVLILGISPHLLLAKKVQAVIDYMDDHGLTVQNSDYGMRDYLMHVLRDASGVPAVFPSGGLPDFPDEWITPVPLDPTGVTQSWTILW